MDSVGRIDERGCTVDTILGGGLAVVAMAGGDLEGDFILQADVLSHLVLPQEQQWLESRSWQPWRAKTWWALLLHPANGLSGPFRLQRY